MPDVELRVNGKAYAGWTSARVTRGIESIAGGFELSVSDRWEAGANPWPIYEEDECALFVGGSLMITGYVDRRSISYSASEHSLSVAGRDKTGDLVDCSVTGNKWEYFGVPALAIARRVCAPFGVSVTVAPGLTIPKLPEKVAISPGDSPFDVLERLSRLSGILCVSDGAGGLILMRPGSRRAVTALIEGENILAASAEYDASSRFARYVVLGQHVGTDTWSGGGTAGVIGEARDANVRRSARTLVVRPEGNVTPAHAKKRAEWEATVRAARSDAVSVTVQGWRQADGTLWPVNALVALKSPRLGVDGQMLISQATYTVGPEGTTTELTLRGKDAFKPEPVFPIAGWKEIRHGV